MAKPKKEGRKALIARKEAENRKKQRDQAASKPSKQSGGGVEMEDVRGYTRRKPKRGKRR
jgi:hypothetical protein